MKKIYYVPFLLLLILSIVGCNTDTDNASQTSDNVNETTEIIEQDLEEVQEDALRNSDRTKTDTELENEPNNGVTGGNSEQDPAVPNDVGGQGIEDEGQNTDANTVND